MLICKEWNEKVIPTLDYPRLYLRNNNSISLIVRFIIRGIRFPFISIWYPELSEDKNNLIFDNTNYPNLIPYITHLNTSQFELKISDTQYQSLSWLSINLTIPSQLNNLDNLLESINSPKLKTLEVTLPHGSNLEKLHSLKRLTLEQLIIKSPTYNSTYLAKNLSVYILDIKNSLDRLSLTNTRVNVTELEKIISSTYLRSFSFSGLITGTQSENSALSLDTLFSILKTNQQIQQFHLTSMCCEVSKHIILQLLNENRFIIYLNLDVNVKLDAKNPIALGYTFINNTLMSLQTSNRIMIDILNQHWKSSSLKSLRYTTILRHEYHFEFSKYQTIDKLYLSLGDHNQIEKVFNGIVKNLHNLKKLSLILSFRETNGDHLPDFYDQIMSLTSSQNLHKLSLHGINIPTFQLI
ncbi:hypothetical protein DLAC_02284 [Tieghemostelium lacteum]|uniref:Uncharacterized protein n=1 Tax=Tieghemostelium lacteum TaxID=361077 RepID=A0A152A537_TIELA|nr:hypothetical protein DLAC_02284 [Tieghemostelium lacteum]|eukprot:KYR01175.1 hypothetical protein DLAC_02284 [Tieghemostelium lacteum]